MAFNRKFLSNSSATGNDVNIFTYGMNEVSGSAVDDTAAMQASGFFNDAKDVLKKGNIIMLSDGVTPNVVTITSETAAVPVTVAKLPIV